MLMDISSRLLAWRSVNDLPPVKQRDVTIAVLAAGNPELTNTVGTTSVSRNVLPCAGNHVPSRRKFRVAVTRPTE
ncbi:hypothetical protein TNCT_179091 [Trichonephila clavata]|uniref:Uncharacterized protein n=1 Tax=Trichonephila clavata TaxID=2740835 RepID=A0A8X6GQ62_TRICU|nr:hypothetical protein TNCT_179091 [Trichonephila clavata]